MAASIFRLRNVFEYFSKRFLKRLPCFFYRFPSYDIRLKNFNGRITIFFY